MKYDNIYSEDEDEDCFQPTTQEESVRESLAETKFKKWLNSDTDISNISSIYRLELENLNEKNAEITDGNQKGNKNKEYENELEKKERKNYKEENNKIEDESLEKYEKSYEENLSEESFDDSNNNKKNYTFIWKEGGNDVKITGSFSDWKIQFQMTKDPKDQTFKCQLPLASGIYQYKFIVDNVWKYSNNYPTIKDGDGNINNLLDNTKNELDKSNEKNDKKEKNSVTKRKSSKSKKNKKTSRVSTVKTKTRASSKRKESKKIIKKNSIYTSKYPSDDDIIPLPLPNKRYYKSFNFEKYTNQNAIGNKKYYDYYDRYSFSYGASSKPIFILGHVNLNHLISVNHNELNLLKNSMSFRYREKASTFIYYKYK